VLLDVGDIVELAAQLVEGGQSKPGKGGKTGGRRTA